MKILGGSFFMENASKKSYKPYQIHTDPKYSHHRQTSKYLGRGEASYSRGNLLSKFGINLYQKKGIWPDDGIASENLSLLGPSVPITDAGIPTRSQTSMWKTKRERWTWLMTLFSGTVILFLGRMAMPICEVEIMEQFHWNEEQLGRVMSVFFWGYAITQIPGGAAADIYGGGLTIAVSSFLWGTICWVTPMLTIGAGHMFGNGFAYYVLIFLRIVMGLAQAIHFPSMSSVLSQNINDSSKAFAMSFVTSGSQFGTLVCGYLGSKLLAITNWKTVFVTFGISGVSFSIYIFYLNKFSIKSMHRMISLTNLEDAPLLKPTSNPLTAAISGPSSTSFITNPQLKHKNVKSQIFEAARNTLKLGHQLMYKMPFLSLVLVHMSNTNSVFVLSFWLPKYFHDKFPGALPPQYYNVIPWIGVIPGSILFGILSDILVRRTKLTTSHIRRYIECAGVFS